MTRVHFHTSHNVSGYLPEGDVFTYRSRQDAVSASSTDARLHVDEHNEYIEDDGRVASKTGHDGDYYVDDGRSLPTHYWVSDPCACNEGEEELAR